MEPFAMTRPDIVAGFGFTSAATEESLANALAATGYAADVTLMATALDKTMAPPIMALAKTHQVQIAGIFPKKLQAARTQSNSAISRLLRRTGSVAEAAALAAAGPGARLIATRHISDDRMATCAIATGADT
jgi:cobalt-precorrin 5A hydrolase